MIEADVSTLLLQQPDAQPVISVSRALVSKFLFFFLFLVKVDRRLNLA